MDLTFAKQIGIINFLLRGIKIKFLRKLKTNSFIYNTLSGNKYNIYTWDPSGAEVFLTQCFTDWGNEYFFLDSFKERRNGIFLDVGCHSGYYSTLYGDYFDRIIGFEPSSKCIDVLKNLRDQKFSFLQCYVGDKNMEVKSKESPDGYSFYDKTFEDKELSCKNLSQITLDDYCKKNDLQNITAIKIDVDGIDLKVLYGANEIINLYRPCIMIENYSQELLDFFKDKRYSMWTLESFKEKPFNLELNQIVNYDPDKWIKMICCIPNEFNKVYEYKFFRGNFLTGINKKEILKIFNIDF